LPKKQQRKLPRKEGRLNQRLNKPLKTQLMPKNAMKKLPLSVKLLLKRPKIKLRRMPRTSNAPRQKQRKLRQL